MKGVYRLFLGCSLALLALLSAGCMRTVAAVLDIPAGKPGTKIEMNVMVPMRDGVKLATDLYMPFKKGKYPVVLTRIPYGTDGDMYKILGRYFARQGYIFIAQDVRGIEHSEGVWYPLIYEIPDGKDTTEWIKKQPWYNGKIGMWGVSYFGYTQWETALDNPDITCMCPTFTSGNMFNMVINGGAMEYIMVEGWLDSMEAQVTDGEWKPDFETGYYNPPMRPAKVLDLEAVRKNPKNFTAIALLDHPGDLMGQAPGDFTPYYKTVSAPAFMISGWFDQFEQPQLDDFIAIRKEGKGDAKKSHLVVGPWVHGIPSNKEAEGSKWKGPRMFFQQNLRWYDYWLKGINNGIMDEAPVKIFIMGENVWRDEQEWPLARTKYTDYFIHSDGTAARFPGGGGTLSLVAPAGDEPSDNYAYDPKNPMPTRGGTFQPFTGIAAGSFDQTDFLSRPDVLYFETEVLKTGVEVTGQIKVTLYASSSAKDTDFTAMLLDVHPDGTHWYIQDGAVRARFREGYQNMLPLEPGKVYEFTIDLWSTSNYFLPGHRIALEISSSNYPQYNRNTNGGGEGGIQNIVIANQKIFHTKEYPTHVTLPVIPR